MNWRIYLINTLLCSISIHLNGQEFENQTIENYKSYRYNHSQEAAYLKTDKKIYFSGGIIDFNLVIFDQYLRPTGLSKIAYIELVHESEKLQEKYVIRLENGTLEGNIQIPADAPTGNYQLIAYTQFMRNFDLEYLSHRIPLYVQNTSNNPTQVAKEIVYDSTSPKIEIDDAYTIDLRIASSKINVEVTSSDRSSKDYYLISEGFGSLQFIAKLKLKRKQSFLSFSKDQFSGSFQKLILVDEDKNVLAVRYFFLKESTSSVSKEVIFQNQFEIGLDDNLLSTIELNKNTFGRDTLDLFRRMYRLFYELPLSSRINHLSYAELISSTRLSRYSPYGLSRWHDILHSPAENLPIATLPEDNIELKGRVSGGDLSLLENATLNIHFFKNNLDVAIPLTTSGKFGIELIIPVGMDAFFATILDEGENDILENFTLTFNSFPKLKYVSSVDFYDKRMTDELIEKQNNFNYILSTFNHSSTLKKFFWENSQFDRKIKIEDYRDIGSFEEFLREVVTGVTIRKRGEVKSLRMISSEGGDFFAGSPLIILNNSVLKDPALLFELPLESVKTVHLIFSDKALDNFGEPFKNGVIAIATEDSQLEIPDSSLSKNYFEFVGYHRRVMDNDVMKGFSTTKLMNLILDDHFVKSLQHNKESGTFKLTIQGIDKMGYFFRNSKEIRIEK